MVNEKSLNFILAEVNTYYFKSTRNKLYYVVLFIILCVLRAISYLATIDMWQTKSRKLHLISGRFKEILRQNQGNLNNVLWRHRAHHVFLHESVTVDCGECSFQACWLDKPEFKEWLARVPGDTCRAACKICEKNFSVASLGVTAVASLGVTAVASLGVTAVASLGVTAVASHANSKKHKQGENFVVSGQNVSMSKRPHPQWSKRPHGPPYQ